MADPHNHLLRTFASVPPGARVLDLGCGDGARAEALGRLGFSVDAVADEAGDAAAARRRLADAGLGEDAARVHHAPDLAALDVPEAAYDWVVFGERLAHAGSREAAVVLLAEARRLLAPGGWLYLLVPAVPEGMNPNAPSAAYAADSAPVFTFTPESLTALARDAGLDVAERARRGEGDRVHGIFRRVEAGTVG